jgi:molecular chaperone DnaK (HSP70)
LWNWLNPYTAAAGGAAIMAAIKSKSSESTLQNVRLMDVIPMTLGLGVFGRKFNPMIMRNNNLPCSGKEMFSNPTDYADSIVFRVI